MTVYCIAYIYIKFISCFEYVLCTCIFFLITNYFIFSNISSSNLSIDKCLGAFDEKSITHIYIYMTVINLHIT